MITRRSLLSKFAFLAAGGAAVWWLRDGVFWPAPRIGFSEGSSSGWLDFSKPDQGVVIVRATVNGEPVEALLDSGAQSSVIDRTLVERLGLPRAFVAPLVVAFGVSGAPQLGRAARLDLRLGSMTAAGLQAAVLDIAAISRASRRPFELILGQDLLHALVADIDFPNGRVAFHAPETHIPPAGAVPSPARSRGRELLVPITVEGGSLEVVLDTGASGALALSQEAAQAAGLLDGRPVGRAPSITFGGVSQDQLIRARTVGFAGQTYRDVAVHVYTPAQAAPLPAGLLGVEALERFRVILDAGRGRLHLVLWR